MLIFVLNILVNNPSYKDSSLVDGTNKQINNLFIYEFRSMGFRMLVKDLGTESLHETISRLNSWYTGIRTTMRVQRYRGNLILKKSPIKYQKNRVSDGGKCEAPSPKQCSSTHYIGRTQKGIPHKHVKCWMLHPEQHPPAPP